MGVGWVVCTLILVGLTLSAFVDCQGPMVVNVGAVFAFDSVIGRVAKVAIQAAADDINADQTLLRGVKLNFVLGDSKCSVFMGSIGVFNVLERGVVAIIGPQSSSIAHMISFIANGLQVPLISFAATDPTLSALQFPFFLRSTLSDSYEMAAMADLISFYGWHDVISIYVDDDYGRNGISSLDDELAKRMARTYKLPLPVGANHNDIVDVLENSKLLGARVYVVHVGPDSGLAILSIAHQLQMMTSDYAWFTTSWFSATLDSSRNPTLLKTLRGVVGLRQYMPPSKERKSFLYRWKELRQKQSLSFGLNNYGLYAYDTVWVVARAIDEYLKDHGNITFSYHQNLHDMKQSTLHLENLKTFDGGNHLLEKLQQTNFTGLTGRIKFDAERNLIGGGYEVINIYPKGIQRIGYWTNHSGLSVIPPEMLKGVNRSNSSLIQELTNATWPGGKVDKPRGWVIATNERPLRIGFPNRTSFTEFVSEVPDSHEVQGYCIDVFNAALKFIPYDVPHEFEAFGDGQLNPNFDELVRMVSMDVFDAVVGDITIITNRTRVADFTQPYAANGLVILIPLKDSKSNAWVFLKPFTVEMWCVTAAFFVVVGVVVWILEHRINNDFRGPPKKQIITMLLFSFSTLFKTNQETTVSSLGKMVMMVWLFLLMVITSSYTASLTSILTVEQLSSPITGIDTLIASNLPIGCQGGSFVKGYLMENLNIHPSRLISLASPEDYAESLRQGPNNGGVAAVVDELPYIELFLSKYSQFVMVGQMFTRSGWGFAFKRGSPLAVDMSTAILKLTENGELERIRRDWFCKLGCASDRTHEPDPNQLRLSSFLGLFLLCAIVTITAFIVFLLQTIRQFVRYKKRQRDQSSISSPQGMPIISCSQVVYNFFDFIDEKEEAMKRMFKHHDPPEPQVH